MASKRQQIIDTATALFCRKGFHTTGIDEVIEEAGIAKMTLYNNFASKEDLIVACLEHLDARSIAWFEAQLEKSATTARGRLLKMGDVLHAYVTSEAFFGCPFVRAATEFGSLEHRIHQQAQTFKKRLLDLFEGLAREGGLTAPKRVSEQLQVIMEGAIAMALVSGNAGVAKTAGDLIREVVARASR
jgi:AcrR family transcriptional regulator